MASLEPGECKCLYKSWIIRSRLLRSSCIEANCAVNVFNAGSVGEGVSCRSADGFDCPDIFRGEDGRRSIGEGATYPGVFGGLLGYRGVYVNFCAMGSGDTGTVGD